MSLQTRLEALITAIGADIKRSVTTDGGTSATPQVITGFKRFAERLSSDKQVRGTDFELSNVGGSYSVNAAWNPTAARWEYISAGRAFLMQHDNTTGQLYFRTAPSGTAGAAITWTEVGSLGNLGTFDYTNRVVATTDARLSDARTPTAHTHNAATDLTGVMPNAQVPVRIRFSTNSNRLSDPNLATDSGWSFITGTTNAPVAGLSSYFVHTVADTVGSNFYTQVATEPAATARMWVRSYTGSAWTAWALMLQSNDSRLTNMVTTDAAQTVTGVKTFAAGALLMQNGGVTAQPYSDANPPESLIMTEYVAGPPPAPALGLATMYTTDGKTLRMRADDGADTLIGPSAGGGASPVTVYELTTDRAYTTVSLADIPEWIIPLPANSVVTLDAILVLQSAALTTGWQLNGIVRNAANTLNVNPTRFLLVYEYQTSATAWATLTQTVHTTPPTLITAAYVANSGIMVKITGQIDVGATAGELRMQARSEIAGSAITLRKGSPLRVM